MIWDRFGKTSTMETSQIKTLAFKVGISSEDVIRKAQELLRLCEVRSVAGTALCPNSSCKAVMCIELAANSMDQPIDKNSLIRISGVTRKVYTTIYKTLENLLEMNQDVTVRDLAVQFGCLPAVTPALEILARYRKDFDGKMSESTKEDVNFNGPLFTTGSLYTACRHLKIKAEKTKYLAVAGVKRSTFDRLCSELTKHAMDVIVGDKSTSKSKRQGHWLDDLEKSFEDECSPPKKQLTKKQNGSTNSDYEEWKRRILEGANTKT